VSTRDSNKPRSVASRAVILSKRFAESAHKLCQSMNIPAVFVPRTRVSLHETFLVCCTYTCEFSISFKGSPWQARGATGSGFRGSGAFECLKSDWCTGRLHRPGLVRCIDFTACTGCTAQATILQVNSSRRETGVLYMS
jgi:hypothetical protein